MGTALGRKNWEVVVRLAFSICLALVFSVVLAAWPSPLAAQHYSFRVERMELEVFVQPDASARLQYTIVFANQPFARAIDVVDIGLPHRNYDLDTMSASIDDHPLTVIRPSEYVDVGVEVPLHVHPIRPGEQGTFTFTCTMPDMVYSDTTDRTLAAMEIMPTWFDPSLQVGTTDLRIAIHLPPGVEPEEVRYHREETRYDELVRVDDGDQVYVAALWQWPEQRLSSNNPKVGISFPRRVMDRVVEITALGLFAMWFDQSIEAQIVSGALLLAALALLFFRFSGGTGFTVYAILVALVAFAMLQTSVAHFWLWPAVLALIGVNEWFLRNRPTTGYLPAMATVEGGGIKRGLTAPQAAVLLERPLGQVLTLVIFGLLKKRALEQVAEDPLTVRVRKEFQVPRGKRREAAAQQGIVLHEYEHPFIDQLVASDRPVAERNFSSSLGQLVRSTASMMEGFDLAGTRDYYQRIVSRAWREAEAIGELDKRSEAVDRNLEWMVLDPRSRQRFDHWHHRGFYYRPAWGRTATSGTSTATAAASAAPQIRLGQVAGSFAGWMENTAAGLASTIEPTKMGLESPAVRMIDLSGVDRVTGDVFAALAESGKGGGGGGGGGCACACAGCACACACAGGGR